MVTFLLKEGANPLLRGSDGWPPLHLAALNGFTECVRALLADPRIDPLAIANGYDILLISVLYSQIELLKFILEDGRISEVSKRASMRFALDHNQNTIFQMISDTITE
jgi:ankyrin repeat protein